MGTLTDSLRQSGRQFATPSEEGGGVGQISEREQAIIDRHRRNVPQGSRLFRDVAQAGAEEEIAARRQQRAHAEKAPPAIAEPVRRMLLSLSDREGLLDTYRKLTPEQRQEALNLAPGIAQQLGDDRGGGAERTLDAIRRGVSTVIQPGMELAGRLTGTDWGGTDEEIAFIRQLEGLASQEFTPARPGDPWYERFPLQALEMAPFSAITVGAGIGGGAAAKAGGQLLARGASAGVPGAKAAFQATGAVGRLPRAIGLKGATTKGTMQAAGTLAGITAAGFPMQYAQEIDQLKELGMEDGPRLQSLAVGTALVASALEGIMPNPFKAGKVPLRDGAMKAARSYLWEAAKRAPAEMSEEYAQGLASGVGKVVANWIDENAEERTLADAFEMSFEQGNAALGPMAFMLGVPAAGGAGLSAARAQRLTRLQKILDKGSVSRKEGKELGIEGNQEERTAKAIAELEALQQVTLIQSPSDPFGTSEATVQPSTDPFGATEATVQSPTELIGTTESVVQQDPFADPFAQQGVPDASQVQPNEEIAVQGQARVEGEQETGIQGKQAAQGDAGTEVQVGTYEEFREEYRRLFGEMMKYRPDEIGSSHYAEKMAILSDQNPEWAERVESEEDPFTPATDVAKPPVTPAQPSRTWVERQGDSDGIKTIYDSGEFKIYEGEDGVFTASETGSNGQDYGLLPEWDSLEKAQAYIDRFVSKKKNQTQADVDERNARVSKERDISNLTQALNDNPDVNAINAVKKYGIDPSDKDAISAQIKKLGGKPPVTPAPQGSPSTAGLSEGTTVSSTVSSDAPATPETSMGEAVVGRSSEARAEDAPKQSPRVYREMAADELDSIINPNTSSGETFGGTERFWSDNPDLAIGQGTNKGFIVELDPSGLSLKEHAKPGTAVPGVGKEFTTRHRAEEFRQGVRSVTIKPGANSPSAIRVKRFLESEVKAGRWSKAKAESGGVVYSPTGEQDTGTKRGQSGEQVGNKPAKAPPEQAKGDGPTTVAPDVSAIADKTTDKAPPEQPRPELKLDPNDLNRYTMKADLGATQRLDNLIDSASVEQLEKLVNDGVRGLIKRGMASDDMTQGFSGAALIQRAKFVLEKKKAATPEQTKGDGPATTEEKKVKDEAPADEPIPEFTRTTPDKGSTTRQFQAERVGKARSEIADLERKRRAKQGEHDKLRSNATKKRAAARGEIESFNRMIGKIEGEIASDMAADTRAKLEDELESPRSYDHYLAGMKAIHRLQAGVAEDAARRGEMGRDAARAEVAKEGRESDRFDAELQGRAKNIAKSQGFDSGDAEQIALAASNGFTVFEDRSLADVVEVQGKRTRESRVSQEIGKMFSPGYAAKQDLNDEQKESFKKQYQEASLDDKDWLAKRGEVDKAVSEAIKANREAIKANREAIRQEKEAEKAKEEQEALANARERAKKHFLDERISKALKKKKTKTTPVKIRQETSGGPVKVVDGKTIDGDKNGALYPNGLILHQSFEEGSKDFVLTHARSGLGFPFSAKKSDMQELVGLIDILGVDFNVDTDEKGALPSELQSRMKKINTAWDNGDYAMLSEQDHATVEALAEVTKTDIDADLILTADDLGANGIPSGLDKVMSTRGLQAVKEMAIAVPEFAYDPVFTVQDGKLLYRDGYEFKLEPQAFNLHPSELKEGQTVGINLEDLGIKRATPQDVVAGVMKGAGFHRVTKGKGGDVSVSDGASMAVSLQQGENDNDWVVVGGKPKVRGMAIAALKKIRWRQPGQTGDPTTDINQGETETKESTEQQQPKAESSVEEPESGEGGGIASMVDSIPTRQSRTTQRSAEGEAAGITAADIQKTAERLFNVAIRQGGFNQRAAGIYKWITKRNSPPSPEVIRTAEDHYANLAVIAHEIAHHIDETTKTVRSMPKAVKDEVARLDYEPEKGRAFEGWAEFLRRYMTEPPIDVAGNSIPNPGIDAPQTMAWFEGTFLQANPEVAKAIAEFRQYAQQYAQQSVFQRVSTLISDRQPQDLSFKERWLAKSKRRLHRVKTAFVDKFHTLEWIQEEAKRLGHKGIGIYDMTMAYFMSATSHATIAFEEGVRNLQTGKPIGKTTLWGLREHLESDGEYESATLYALARHTVFMDSKKPGYNTGMDIHDAEAWIAEVEANGQKERFEAFARDLATFNNDLIEMLVQAGALSPTDAATMLEYYGGKNYFPLHRVKDVDTSMFAGAGAGFVNLGKAVRKRSRLGSGRQIIDPVDATVAQAIRFYGRAIQARQQHVLAETLDPLRGGVGGMGGLMDRVDPKRIVHRGTIKEILGTLVEEGVVEADDAKAMRIAAALLDGDGMPSQDSLDWFAERHGIEADNEAAIIDAAKQEPNALAFISLWRPDFTPNAAKRTVRIYDKNGEPLMYELDPDLYATATGMDDIQFGPFMSTLREASRYFKSGAVGLSTGFGTANLLRDYWEFQGKARHTKGLNSLGKPPEMLGRYVAAKVKQAFGGTADNALIRLYEETGGKVYSVVGHDVHGRKMYRRRRLGKTTMSRMGIALKRPGDTAQRGLQAVQELIAISDAPPRLADAEAAIREEGYERRLDKWYDLNTDELVDHLPEHVRIKAAVAMAEATINFKRIGSKGQYVEAFMPFFNATVQASYRQYKQLRSLKSLGKKDSEGMQAKRYLVYLSALASTAVLYWLWRNDDEDWREQDAYLRDGFWTWGKDGKTYLRIPKPRDTAVVTNVVENMLDSWYHDDARSMPELLLRDFGGRMPTGGGLARGVIETYIADYDYFREQDLTPYNLQKLPKELQVTPYTSRVSDTIGKVTGRYLGTSPIQVEHLLSSASGGLYHRLTDLYEAADEGRIGPEHIPFLRGLFIDRHQARSVNDFYDELEATDNAMELEKASGEVSDAIIAKLAVMEGHAELMTKLRSMEGRKGKKREYEYQPYIVGLARHSLGYDSLPNNPNPLFDRDVPQPIADAMQDYKARAAMLASETLKKRDDYKDEESYESQRKTLVRGKAKLATLGLTLDEAKQLLKDHWKKQGWPVKEKDVYVDALQKRFIILRKLYEAE